MIFLIFFISELPAYAIGTETCDGVTYHCCWNHNETTYSYTWSADCTYGENGYSYVHDCTLNSGGSAAPTSGCTPG